MPTYELRGVSVEFPHEAYDCQLKYMECVIEALQEGKPGVLESPTGTGKTLCLLCASLAWQETQRPKAPAWPSKGSDAPCKDSQEVQQPIGWADGLQSMLARDAAGPAPTTRLPAIIYTSRTHSQLAQVIRELKRTSYRPRMTVLGSRQQMCMHPTVSKVPVAASGPACKAACSGGSCTWHHRTAPFMAQNPDVNSEPHDIEDLVRIGRGRGPCPFYLSRDMAETADLIFMPYNYVLDGRTRMTLSSINWQGAAVIFDEAHNVEQSCSDAASFDLRADLLADCIREVEAATKQASLMREAGKRRQYDGLGLRVRI